MANRFKANQVPIAEEPAKKNRFQRGGEIIPPYMERVPISAREPKEVTREQRVMKEFNAAPYPRQAMQAADDMARLFSTGATYSSLDAMGGPEERFATDEARARAGIPGTVMEIGGTLASPITRTVGAGARALTPATGILGRTAVASGEGATLGGLGALLSGNPEDLFSDMGVGAALPPAVMAAGKMLSVPTKYLSAILAGKNPESYRTAFKAGREGGAVSKAFTEGRSEGTSAVMSPELVGRFASKKKGWGALTNLNPVGKELLSFIRDKQNKSGVYNLTEKEVKKLDEITELVLEASKHTSDISNLNALRTKLGAYNPTKKAKDSEIGRLATTLQRTIEEQITKQNKVYGQDLAKLGRGKAAFEAGQKLSKALPNANAIENMALNAAGIGASAFGGALFNPALYAAIPALAVAGSPKGAGSVAHTVGKAFGIGDLLGGGKSDAAIPMSIYNNLSDEDKKTLRGYLKDAGIR